MVMRGGVAVVVAGLIASLPSLPARAGAPSFNCALAQAPLEKLICADDALADLDADLGRAYQARRLALADGERPALLAEQRDWLKGRLARCKLPAQGTLDLAAAAPAAACLAKLYQARIDQLAATVPGTAAPESLGFASSRLPATGRQETILTVPQFGRHTITVTSAQGSSLQLIDRLAGPGEVAGGAGARNGRLDEFLERGTYKIVVLSDDHGSGDATLAVRPFVERNEQPVGLVDLGQVDSDLDDGQQRSYWIRLDKRETLLVEAAGRNLADLRLWRDGTWLVDAAPKTAELTPRTGRPLTGLSLSADLSSGLYRLTAYGGPALPWSGDAEAHPFHLRRGIPTLAEAGRARRTAGPFGIDRFLVPGNTTHLRLEVPAQGDLATMSVVDFSPSTIFPEYAGGSWPRRAVIAKTTVPPVVEMTLSRSSQPHLVSISREPGSSYVLQHMTTSTGLPSTLRGPMVVSTLVSGQAEDMVDATAVLLQDNAVIAAQTVELDGRTAWRRRFNLLGPVSVLLHVSAPGDYVVEASGADGEYRFEPLFPPKDHRPSRFEPAGQTWPLDTGYWVLRAQPRQDGKGVVTVAVRPAALSDAPVSPQPRLGAIHLGPVTFDRTKHKYALTLGSQAGITTGVAAYPVPTPLGGLPLSLPAGTSRSVDITVPAGQVLSASREDGTPLEMSVDGGPPTTAPQPAAGGHTVRLTNSGDTVLNTVLEARPVTAPPATPAIPPATLAAVGQFPALEPGVPQFADLGTEEGATYALTVGEPALYRLESTGLLQTAGNLRTVGRTSLARAAANGAGRNFLLQQYLREGLYQLTVGTQRKTQGHLGVTVSKAPVREGGYLVEGVPARATLAAGEAIVYRLEVPEAGRYRLEAVGLTEPVTMRFEDEDGWPLLPPGRPATLDQDLRPGTYRVVLLPPALPGRVVTLVERVRPLPAFAGHGPHPLTFGQTVANQWLEPANKGARTPDTWRFDLPAPADTTVHLSEGMEAHLRRDGDAAPHALVSWKRDWSGRLPAGAWRLEARTVRPNNRFDYTLRVDVAQLLPGQRRTVTAPSTVELSLGDECLMEAASFGTTDVAARLLDPSGRLLDQSDDRTDDWNFAISRRLDAGFYRLNVTPVGAAHGETTVSLACWDEVEEAPLALGRPVTIADGKLHGWPVTAGKEPLLVFAARSRDEVGLAVDVRSGDGWRTLASTNGRTAWLAVPGDGQDLRLRLWSISRGGSPILLSSQAVTPNRITEKDLAKGAALATIPGLEAKLSAALVTLDQPGLLQISGAPAGLAWSDRLGRAVAPAGEVLASADGRLWLVGEGPVKVTARRVGFGDDGLRFLLPADARPTLMVEGRDPQMWIAQALVGQPGLAATPRGQPIDIRRMGVSGNATVTVGPGHGPALGLSLWNAGAPGEPQALAIRRVGFGPVAKPRALDWGVSDFMVNRSDHLTLPTGLKLLTLTLPADTAAVLARGDEVLATLWSGDQMTSTLLDSEADRLLLLRTSAEAGSVSLALARTTTPTLRLGDGLVFKRSFAAAGSVRLAVTLSAAEQTAAAKGRLRLRLAGPRLAATLTERSGRVSRGDDLLVAEAGILELDHAAGLVVAWLDAGDDSSWPPARFDGPPLKLPASVALSGASAVLPVMATAPTLVHLGTTTPALIGVRGPGRPTETALYPHGANLHLVATKGTTLVALQPAGDGGLSGILQATATTPLPLDEGLGPKMALAPGDARLFHFTLSEAGPIGIGVRGSVDSARCRLLDAEGRERAVGVVSMVHLEPGTYYLAVENPPDAPPVLVQPALVGKVKPDKGPPADVRRSFLELVSQPE